MTRVTLYGRVSTAEQASEGVSLAAQRARLEAYCIALDLSPVAYHEDAGVSAKTLERPGLAAALADLDEGRADGLLIAKLDRLTRSVVDLGTLLTRYFREKFSLLSVADSVDTRSAGGRLVLNVLMSVAEWERESIAERTSVALKHLQSQGVRLGAVPLGLRVVGKDEEGRRKFEPDPVEAAVAQRIVALRADGLTLRQIAAVLQAEGIPTKKGGRWGPETIRLVLARAA